MEKFSKDPSEHSIAARFFVEKKSVFPGLHKGGERDGLPGHFPESTAKPAASSAAFLVGNKVIH